MSKAIEVAIYLVVGAIIGFWSGVIMALIK